VCEQRRFLPYIYRELIVFVRGAQDQVFPGDRTQPLVAGPGKQYIRYRPPSSREQFGNWPTRGTRRQGDRDLTHPIIGRPKKPFRDLQSGTGRLRTSLTLCRSFDSRVRDWSVCRLCFLCVMPNSL